jgi:hypothetical protein
MEARFSIWFNARQMLGILSRDLQKDAAEVFIEFGVVNDNVNIVELNFSNTFSNLNISFSNHRISEKDYSQLIKDENILLFCKNEILNTDEYFLENGSFYSLRILKINQFDLDFIWNPDDDDESTQKLVSFFQENLDDFDELISDFISDNFCSLSYLNDL